MLIRASRLMREDIIRLLLHAGAAINATNKVNEAKHHNKWHFLIVKMFSFNKSVMLI